MSGVTADDVAVIGAELRAQGWHVRRHRQANSNRSRGGLVANNASGQRAVITTAGGHQLEKLLAKLSRLGATGIADWPLASTRAARRYAPPRPAPAPPPAEPSEEDTIMTKPNGATNTRQALAELETMSRPGDRLMLKDLIAMYPQVSPNALRQAFYKRAGLGVWQSTGKSGEYVYAGAGGLVSTTTDSELAAPIGAGAPEQPARDNAVSLGRQAVEHAPPSDLPSAPPTHQETPLARRAPTLEMRYDEASTRHMFERREPPVRLPSGQAAAWERLATDVVKLAHSDASGQWHQLAHLAADDLPEDLAVLMPGGHALELVVTDELEVFARWVPST